MQRSMIPAILVGLACLSVAGCANLGPKADPSRFYTLTPLALSEANQAGGLPNPGRITVGIGPVHFPGYLDREQLVTRVSENRLEVAENDRWAEPLEENFTRVLTQNLSALLDTDRFIRYPWPPRERPDHQVEIEVLRFEPTAGSVQLTARWSIRDTATRRGDVRESRLTRPVKGASTEQSVAALSAVLADLSGEIAEAVRVLGAHTK